MKGSSKAQLKYKATKTGSDTSLSSCGTESEAANRKGRIHYQYEIDRIIHELPDAESWPHRPVFLAPGESTVCKTPSLYHSCNESLPFSKPLEFESELFKGKMFMRLRNAPNTNQEYFKGKRRTKQLVIQGQFKQRLSCDDVWIGDIYDKPLNIFPLVRIAIPIFKRLVPGIILKIFSKKPRVMMLMGGEARTISVHAPGDEPDLEGKMCERNTQFFGGKSFQSIKHRRKMLRDPKTASKYSYDPKYVYTFEFYDDIIDICDYSINLPIGKISLLHFLNYQPMTFAGVTSDINKELFNFKIFHEDLLNSV